MGQILKIEIGLLEQVRAMVAKHQLFDKKFGALEFEWVFVISTVSTASAELPLPGGRLEGPFDRKAQTQR